MTDIGLRQAWKNMITSIRLLNLFKSHSTNQADLNRQYIHTRVYLLLLITCIASCSFVLQSLSAVDLKPFSFHPRRTIRTSSRSLSGQCELSMHKHIDSVRRVHDRTPRHVIPSNMQHPDIIQYFNGYGESTSNAVFGDGHHFRSWKGTFIDV